jgi:hypothetical protein
VIRAAMTQERDLIYAITAVVSFCIALILDLAGISNGHFDPETFMLAGMVFLALAACAPGWPRRP